MHLKEAAILFLVFLSSCLNYSCYKDILNRFLSSHDLLNFLFSRKLIKLKHILELIRSSDSNASRHVFKVSRCTSGGSNVRFQYTVRNEAGVFVGKSHWPLSSRRKSSSEMVTLNIDNFNGLKARLMGVEPLNVYLELFGNLWKEACKRLEVEPTNALVKNDCMSSQMPSVHTSLTTGFRRSISKSN